MRLFLPWNTTVPVLTKIESFIIFVKATFVLVISDFK